MKKLTPLNGFLPVVSLTRVTGAGSLLVLSLPPQAAPQRNRVTVRNRRSLRCIGVSRSDQPTGVVGCAIRSKTLLTLLLNRDFGRQSDVRRTSRSGRASATA